MKKLMILMLLVSVAISNATSVPARIPKHRIDIDLKAGFSLYQGSILENTIDTTISQAMFQGDIMYVYDYWISIGPTFTYMSRSQELTDLEINNNSTHEDKYQNDLWGIGVKVSFPYSFSVNNYFFYSSFLIYYFNYDGDISLRNLNYYIDLGVMIATGYSFGVIIESNINLNHLFDPKIEYMPSNWWNLSIGVRYFMRIYE